MVRCPFKSAKIWNGDEIRFLKKVVSPRRMESCLQVYLSSSTVEGHPLRMWFTVACIGGLNTVGNVSGAGFSINEGS